MFRACKEENGGGGGGDYLISNFLHHAGICSLGIVDEFLAPLLARDLIDFVIIYFMTAA